MDEPRATGSGAYSRARPLGSAPARTDMLTPTLPWTPMPSWALIVLPSACETLTVGMVIVGSVPPRPGALPGALLATITALAPAACAWAAFTLNVQVPRSTRAMLPLTAAALVKGWHPSAVAPMPSLARMMLPVTPGAETGGPKDAEPTRYTPEIAGGESTVRPGVPNPRKPGTAAVTVGPSKTTRLVLNADAARWALLITSQCSPLEMSSVNVEKMSLRNGGPAFEPESSLTKFAKPRPCPNSCSRTVISSMFVPWFRSVP